MAYFTAIIVAAGSSSRMEKDKLFFDIDGEPLIVKTVSAFVSADTVNEIVIVTRHDTSEKISSLLKAKGYNKKLIFAEGGNCRQMSVFNGFKARSPESEYVCIHDGARPFVLPCDIDSVNNCALSHGAAVCGVKAVNTVKILDSDGFIEKTLDRNSLISVYTPQSFSNDIYTRAVDTFGDSLSDFTDDASLVEACGYRVKYVECGRENIKITYPADLKLL